MHLSLPFHSNEIKPRKRFVTAFLIGGALLSIFGGTHAKGGPAAPPGFADIVQPLLPAVVNISTTSEVPADRRGFEFPDIPQDHALAELFKRFFEEQLYNRPRKSTSLGSGFIIDPAGYIVTSNHVIADADEITVILNNENKTELKAKIVGRDRRTDLALLKVDTLEKLPYVEWGDSDAARVGDWIIAVGNPFGLSSTVTAGIVSTTSRDISRSAVGSSADYINGYIQTDASINMGNSGGPMFNMAGKVIGINSAILTPSAGNVGIGFAVPSAFAKPVIEQLKKHGRTSRGWLGVKIQPVTPEIAKALKLEKAEGALVSSITPKSPAEKANFKPRDVILEFNSKPVKDVRSLPFMVGETKIGEKVPVVVWRNGRKETLSVMVGEFEQAEEAGLLALDMEDRPSSSAAQEVLGVTVRTLQGRDREELGIPADVKGVVILRIDPSSQAAETGELQRGEVITHINDVSVTSPEDLVRELQKAQREQRSSVILTVQRGRESHFAGLSVPKEGISFSKKRGVKKRSRGE